MTRTMLLRLAIVTMVFIPVATLVDAGCVTPTITGVSPSGGPAAGGTSVTITGTNFAAPATATFGGVAATNVVVVNSTTMTATTPAHAAGAVDVVVQACAFSNSAPFPNGFTYAASSAVPTFSTLTLAALAGILALAGALVMKR
jgi:hypothetical protein